MSSRLKIVIFLCLALCNQAYAHDSLDSARSTLETRGDAAYSESNFEFYEQASINIFSNGWIDSQPAGSGDADWECLTEAVYFEARGETVKGQFAVAEVILNRVESRRFPDTICGVINQGKGKIYQCQFTYNCDGYDNVIDDVRAFGRVGKVARAILDGQKHDITIGATHYHASKVNPDWSRIYTRTVTIGSHIFYRHNFRTASNR
ncbi:MAG: cell wall hydrolase [Aestuariivita sp.]|nr:cell wall hydrolase [Aestuariivita sp.]